MVKYIVKRVLQAIPVLIALSVVVFLIMRVFSADPAPVVLGEHATREAMDAWRDSMGLNDPIWKQYLDFVAGALHGDLGTSYYTHTAVTTEIMSRFPATIELAIVAIIIASIVGIALGVVSSVNKGKFVDAFSTFLALIGVSMPIFWLGILFIIFFTGMLHILPSGGRIDPIMQPVGGTGLFLLDTLLSGDFEAFGNAAVHMIMPACALSMYSMAIITRMTRSSMLDTLNEDYVRTARAKGLPDGKVTRHHALRNAMLPVSTVIGLQLGSLLGGALLTETVFAWPGIGKYVVECILKSDFPVVQGVVLLIGVIFVLINLVVDIIYAFLDPRIKYTQGEGVIAMAEATATVANDAAEAAKKESLWKDVWYSLSHNKAAMVSLAFIALLAVVAVVTALFPSILPYDPYSQDLTQSFAEPSAAHIFGCDQQGRDMFSRILVGTQITLAVGLLSVAISLTVGVALGAIAGYKGGAVDTFIMRCMDVMLAVPSILLAITFMAALGKGIDKAVVAIGLVSIPEYARIVRSQILAVKESDYVAAARVIGDSDAKIIIRHILPNVMPSIIVRATLGISSAILDCAALGFLGLGVQPPAAEWGDMLGRGRNYIFSAPHAMLFPGMMITLTVLAFNLLGDGVRDALDPKSRKR